MSAPDADAVAVAVVDAVCNPNPGPGGWGCVLAGRGPAGERSGGEARTTLMRMELQGALAAVGMAPAAGVLIRTKSMYLCDGINRWLAGWDRRGLLDREVKDSPKNSDLWRGLRDAIRTVPVRCEWIPRERRERELARANGLALAAAPAAKAGQGAGGDSPAKAPGPRARQESPAPGAGLHVFTDGSCLSNPGPGGWGAVIVNGGEVRHLSGGEPATTNNRMELRAAIESLRSIGAGIPVTVHTDSTYVRSGITAWARKWAAQGLLAPPLDGVEPGKPKNRDLWAQLLELDTGRAVEWVWVRGHSGDEHNEAAHRLAHAAARQAADAA